MIGPPGSGKGTQAAVLAAKLKIPHLSTGDVLRAMAQSQTAEGLELHRIMTEGKLVPSEMVNKFVLISLQSKITGCILDGYPRNLEQAKFLTQNYQGKIQAIYFKIDKSLVAERVAGRFSCNHCGKIYNRYLSQPMTDTVCDKCGSHDFLFRSDDNLAAVTARLDAYTTETEPVVKYYTTKGLLKTLRADRSVSEISEELLSIVKSH